MNKLLSANMVRLKKSGVFWIGMASLLVIGIFIVINQWDLVKNGSTVTLDSIFFGYTLLLTIPSAVFISLFLGTEYSDGTIRNKLVVGHHRSSVYLSNLITCVFALLLMGLVYMIILMTLGTVCLGFFVNNMNIIFSFFISSIMMIIALASIFTMLSMLNQNKANAAVINVLFIFLLLFIAISIQTKLNEPEFYPHLVHDALGNVILDEEIANPNYLQGTKRLVYEFFFDFLPTGQALQISNMSAVNLWKLPLYSLIITLVTTICGLFFFHKKDLK